ncbi:MAG: HAD family phosphatase [Betaproteobacteria bacterium]|nr:MAG: HAD family phosphatase [Betaproteobacteria bacterium]
MKPLAALPNIARQDIRCVLTDIDDTLSTQGRITAETYTAMEALHAAGYLVIPVTGRPAGWCDHIARMWPVDAIVGENGALYMRHDDVARVLKKRFVADEAERKRDRQRLAAIGEKILCGIPGCAIASDQQYRETDIAIDYCEDVVPLSREDVERIVAMMRSEGMNAKVSSIHVNGWFGSYDKLAMTRTLLAEEFGIDLDAEQQRCIFIGDSPNDAPMFGFFSYSIGVANVHAFGDAIATPPKYVTTAKAGAGFAELATFLLG